MVQTKATKSEAFANVAKQRMALKSQELFSAKQARAEVELVDVSIN